MFTKAIIVSAIASLAAAAPAPIAIARDTTNNFGLVASHSGSDIQGSGIVASGNAFYIGKASSAYCPSEVSGLDCTACMFHSHLCTRNTTNDHRFQQHILRIQP